MLIADDAQWLDRSSLDVLTFIARRLDNEPVVLIAALRGGFRTALEEAGLVELARTRSGSSDPVELLSPAHASEVRFQHPLIWSAVESAAPPAQRLAMYAALAKVVRDPERRLWHRAAAAVGDDDEVASALDEQRKSRAGAVMVAAAALERAAMLTADPRRKGERLVRAAELVYDLGRVDVVGRLLREAESLQVGPVEAARVAWLQQMISGDVWFEKGAAKTFVTTAYQLLAGGDPDAALRSLVPIAHRCWWTRSRARTRQYVVEAAEGMGLPDDDPRLLAVIALADPEVTGPWVRRRVARSRVQELADPVAAMYVGIAAEKAGDFAVGTRFLARAVERLREQSRLGVLAQALVHYAWVASYAGGWEAAERAGAEAATLARDTRQPQFGLTGQLVAALAAALRGSETGLDGMLTEPERALTASRSSRSPRGRNCAQPSIRGAKKRSVDRSEGSAPGTERQRGAQNSLRSRPSSQLDHGRAVDLEPHALVGAGCDRADDSGALGPTQDAVGFNALADPEDGRGGIPVLCTPVLSVWGARYRTQRDARTWRESRTKRGDARQSLPVRVPGTERDRVVCPAQIRFPGTRNSTGVVQPPIRARVG